MEMYVYLLEEGLQRVGWETDLDPKAQSYNFAILFFKKINASVENSFFF